MLYPSPIQLSHMYGHIAHGVLQGGPKCKWRNTSFGNCEPSTVSVSLSVVKCGGVCTAQTYAHSGIETIHVGQGVSTGWAKKFEKKIKFLTVRRLYVSQQRLKIEAYRQRTYLFNRPCTPCRNPRKTCVREKAMSNAYGGFVSVPLTHL